MDFLWHRPIARALPCNSRVDVLLFPLSRPSINLLGRSPSPFHLHQPFLGLAAKSRVRSDSCNATNPGSPSPESDQNLGTDPIPTSGVEATFSRVQDRVQIFFAVLFWMSLFFWVCIGDGRNDDRPTKGSRFRR